MKGFISCLGKATYHPDQLVAGQRLGDRQEKRGGGGEKDSRIPGFKELIQTDAENT